MQLAFLVACVLLLVGFTLRARLRFLQALFIPAAVVGGAIGFGFVLFLQSSLASRLPSSLVDAGAACADQWRSWPSWLIAVVFAGMLLERPGVSMQESLKRAASAGIFAWFIIMGEIALGFLVTWIALEPTGVPRIFGQLLEVSWAGGFGSSNAWGSAFSCPPTGFAEARDLATFFAAAGILWGVVSGIVLVNIAVRRGWTRSAQARVVFTSGLEPRRDPKPIGFGRAGGGGVLDPLVFQAVVLAAALIVGIGLQCVVAKCGDHLSSLTGKAVFSDALGSLPLFLFALLGGWIVRLLMQLMKIDDLIDPDSLKRLTTAAMEFLIVAALASMRLSSLKNFGFASIVLMLVGAAWCIFAITWAARRMLPKQHWFELGLLNYGMATATTAQGMMLLRIIDKDLESGASEEYALAAPLSAPFIGGGFITFALPVLLQSVSVGWVVCTSGALTIMLFLAGRAVTRAQTID